MQIFTSLNHADFVVQRCLDSSLWLIFKRKFSTLIKAKQGTSDQMINERESIWLGRVQKSLCCNVQRGSVRQSWFMLPLFHFLMRLNFIKFEEFLFNMCFL